MSGIFLMYRVVFFVGLTCFLSSCAKQVYPSEHPVETAEVMQADPMTATTLPTSTKVIPTTSPTATLLPTSTPIPIFSMVERPHLIVQNYPATSLSIYTADGKQSILQLPDGGKIYDLRQSLSPDGNWLAYFTGSFDLPGSETTLNLLSLKDGRTLKVSSLIAEGFPENMRPIAKELAKKNSEPGISEDEWFEIIRSNFPFAVRAVAWSPDSRQVAFSAQIDGPSSDIYIYDLASAKIRRVVDDLDNAANVGWSPDGKWLTINNQIPGSIYTGETLSVVRADGSLIHEPQNYKDFWSYGEGWFSPKYYLITGHGDGGPSMDIRVLNVENSQVVHAWPDVYYDFAFDPEHQQLLISGEPEKRSENSEAIKIGVYLVQLDGRRKEITDGEIDNILYLGWKTAPFAGTRPGEVLLINLNGAVTKLADKDGKLAISPDHKWLLLYNDQEIGLYKEPGQLIRSIPATEAEAVDVLWTADSKMVWIQGKTLYSLAIPDGDLTPVKCSSGPCETTLSTAIWVP